MSLPDQIEIDREQIRRKGLAEFIKRAWHLIEPSRPYQHNWHIDVMCQHIMCCIAGQTETDRNQLFNVPPGCCKSITCSAMLTPWVWIEIPDFCLIHASYDIGISQRDADKSLTILRSKWYRDRWPHVVLKSSTPAITDFSNTKGGFRFSTSVESVVTGRHADLKVVDDPIKPLDTIGSAGVTATQLKKVIDWWDGTMTSRNKEPSMARYLIIMQRLHEMDLAGYLLQKDKGHCTHLKLPMRFEPDERCYNANVGCGDPRTKQNELLWPERFDEVSVSKLERDLGASAPAQLQQDPTNPDGDVFHKVWLRYYDSPLLLPHFYDLTLSIDATFKNVSGCDNVSLQLWGNHGPNNYLICDWYEPMSFTDTLSATKRVLAGSAPYCLLPNYRVGAKLIEDKANGSAIMDVLKREVPGLIPVEPNGGKQARANAVSYLHQAGNVIYPNPKTIDAPWITGHINQILGFPKAKKDDCVDAETQYLNWRYANGNNLWSALDQYKNRIQVER